MRSVMCVVSHDIQKYVDFSSCLYSEGFIRVGVSIIMMRRAVTCVRPGSRVNLKFIRSTVSRCERDPSTSFAWTWFFVVLSRETILATTTVQTSSLFKLQFGVGVGADLNMRFCGAVFNKRPFSRPFVASEQQLRGVRVQLVLGHVFILVTWGNRRGWAIVTIERLSPPHQSLYYQDYQNVYS